jgi:hypothetical protein
VADRQPEEAEADDARHGDEQRAGERHSPELTDGESASMGSLPWTSWDRIQT